MDDIDPSFINWFNSNGGFLDVKVVDIKKNPAPEGGRGMVAVDDIQEGHTLFTIPRHLILSTGTSQLPSLFGLEEWRRMGLDKGWSGLILCMMWEQAKGPYSKWHDYLAVLPDEFHTPMFWNEEDLQELTGTAVVEKLGKDDADKEYMETVVPALQSRTDLFPPDTLALDYSLATYHVMGSLILSRSFHVEHWKGIFSENDVMKDSDEHMEEEPTSPPENTDSVDESDDEDSTEVAMVPMADMLNAKFRNENSKLFHEQDCLKMIATKPIKTGDQIWNTYGDLPNAELLRRYGHVDLLPLPDGGIGNPGDVVEIKADLIVDAVMQHQSASLSELQERIDWWLEEGGDDVLVIDSDGEVPPIFLSLTRLFLLPKSQWETVKSKSKPPKAKLELDNLNVLLTTLSQRLKQYPTSLEDDERSMQEVTTLNKKHAVAVRLGEKRILTKVLQRLESMQGDSSLKRKRADDDGEREVRRVGRKS